MKDIFQRYSAHVGRYTAFILQLTMFKVTDWGSSSANPSPADRPEADINSADVVSSLRRADGRHMVVLDIDHPTYLVESSTPDHYHLYIDVPGGIHWDDYLNMLLALADAGVIERGYMRASERRGHTDVRLPWVKKAAAQAQPSAPPAPAPDAPFIAPPESLLKFTEWDLDNE